MNLPELFWNASLRDLKRGFVEKDDCYICLLCGEKIEKGIIYPEDGLLYEAGKYICIHIEKKHQSVFNSLISLGKKFTGLSDHQNRILRLFYEGKSDQEVQKELGTGSVSTIRNHRFALKEKERQAKVFLAIMDILKDKDRNAPQFLEIPNTARMVDDRYNITREEQENILTKYFPQGTDGPLSTFSMREKHKIAVLRELSKRFQKGRIYNEKEVNGILSAAFDDYATLRRYLIEYGFLSRKADGSQYWINVNLNEKDKDSQEIKPESLKKNLLKTDESKESPVKNQEADMDRRKLLKQAYKEIKPQAGVYQIRNTINQKVFVTSTANLKTINGRKISLETGTHMNKKLQAEVNEYGIDAFTFEVLEVLDLKEDGRQDIKDELKKLEEKWINKLQPFGEKGYN